MSLAARARGAALRHVLLPLHAVRTAASAAAAATSAAVRRRAPRASSAAAAAASSAASPSAASSSSSTNSSSSSSSTAAPRPPRATHEHPEDVFAALTAAELVRSAVVSSLSAVPGVASIARLAIDAAEASAPLRVPVHAVLRASVFPQFCAGETLADGVACVERLRHRNIGAILDFAVEAGAASTTPDDVVRVVRATMPHVQRSSAANFSCVKPTALCGHEALSAGSQVVLGRRGPAPDTIDALLAHAALAAPAARGLADFVRHLRAVLDDARALDLPVLIDAEETDVQPVVDALAAWLSREYNAPSVPRPIVYTTFQMYRRDSVDRVGRALADAQRDGYTFAAKLVRGAYMMREAEMAKKGGYASPICASLEDTHRSYNAGMQMCLRAAADPKQRAHLMVASHNEQSLELARATMAELSLAPSHSAVAFAQLYGMSDRLTLGLAEDGYHVLKYVPFGPIQDVMRFLLRRIQENTDVLGSATRDRPLLWRHLWRRMAGHVE